MNGRHAIQYGPFQPTYNVKVCIDGMWFSHYRGPNYEVAKGIRDLNAAQGRDVRMVVMAPREIEVD